MKGDQNVQAVANRCNPSRQHTDPIRSLYKRKNPKQVICSSCLQGAYLEAVFHRWAYQVQYPLLLNTL